MSLRLIPAKSRKSPIHIIRTEIKLTQEDVLETHSCKEQEESHPYH
jgi:hypothetical protein